MTDCPNGEVRDLLPELVNDRLGPAERGRIEAHLRGCAACQEELALLRSLRDVLRRAPAVDSARIASAIAPYRAPASRGPSRVLVGWRVAAAVALLAAGGASMLVARHAPVRPDSSHLAAVRSSSGAASREAPVQAQAPQVASRTRAESSQMAGNTPAAAPEPRELALAGGNVVDLDERELSTLLRDIDTLDAVPSVDVDQPAVVSPIAPSSPIGSYE